MHVRLLAIPLALLAAMTGPAVAERSMIAADGTVYAETVIPTGSQLQAGKRFIVLDRECAAKIRGMGQGSWHWTGQGTVVTIGSYSLRFAGVPLISLYRCAG